MSSATIVEQVDPRILTFEIGANRYLRPISDEEPSSAWVEDESVRWIASLYTGEDDVVALCRTCGIELPLQVAEILWDPSSRPTVLGLERLLFISFYFGLGESKQRAVIICAPTTIITFSRSPEAIDRVARDCERERKLRAQVPLAILIELISVNQEQLSDRVYSLRKELVALSSEVELHDKRISPEEMLALKREATALEIEFEDYLQSTTDIARYESDAIDTSMNRSLMRQFQQDFSASLKAISRLKSRITDLHDSQVRLADETTSRRLKVLTILSAIYLPATLIAGIYGMNFENIPIISMQYGYALVMLIIIFVVFGQLLFFYKRGWFK